MRQATLRGADYRIKHPLIDEFQDTSAIQYRPWSD
jgi:ATP-dependent exoDNAse (exonuclease V) beta subunit